MPLSSPLTLSHQALSAARANFLAFYRTQGWAELEDENVDVTELEGRLGDLWQGWLDRTSLINLQAIDHPSEVNDWFLSLEAGHQKVLVDDKWMLANAVYRAGLNKHLNQVVVDISSAVGTSIVVQTPIVASDNEALKLRIAHLEKVISDTQDDLMNFGSIKADNLAARLSDCVCDTQSYQPALLLPPKMECDDGYPSDDMMEANAFNRCMDTIAEMNAHLKSDFVTNASASNPFWPKLRKKAKVGCTTFAAGISSRSVIAAAERAYEYSQNPPFEAERIERLGALLNQIHGAPTSDESAAKVKALLWHELTPGDYWAFPMKQDIIGRDPRADYVHVFGEPGSLYIEDQLDGITLLSDAHDNNQYVRAVRVERGEVDFYRSYKTTGRTIEADGGKE